MFHSLAQPIAPRNLHAFDNADFVILGEVSCFANPIIIHYFSANSKTLHDYDLTFLFALETMTQNFEFN